MFHKLWVIFFFLLVMFFFIDGHNLLRTTQEIASIEKVITAIEEGRVERRISLFCLLGFAILGMLKESSKKIQINGYFGWLIIFFIAWAFYSVAWSEDLVLTTKRLIALLIFFFLGLAMLKLFTVHQLISWVFFTTLSFLLIGFVTEIMLGSFQPLTEQYRFSGTLHPNHQGINCALMLISGICLLENNKYWRKYFLILICIAVLFLILTKSRTSFISIIFALVVYMGMKLTTSHKFTIFILVTITVCLSLIFKGEAIFPAFKDIVLLGREKDSDVVYSLTGRVPLWKECIKYFKKHPIQGYGYGAFWNEKNIRDISSSEKWLIGEVHSAYIELSLGLGLIGLITYLSLLFGGIKRSIKFHKIYQQDGNYLFFAILLIFCTYDGFLESAIVFPNMLMFLTMISFIYLGFYIIPYKKEIIKE